MLRSIFILGLLGAAPALAQSAAQEARFFAAIQAMEARSYAFYVSVDPRFGALLRPVMEKPAYRDSQRCFLTRIEGEGGSDMLEKYIAAIEYQGATEITSLIDLANGLPEVVFSDLAAAAASDCGPMSFATEQMMTPGFMELMEDPAVMQRLMGE